MAFNPSIDVNSWKLIQWSGEVPKLDGQLTELMLKLSTWGAGVNRALAQPPPASTGGGGGDMTKAVYDTNNNGVVDTADAIPWTSVTGRPATFPPSAHETTHVTGGSDVIGPPTASVSGLAPVLPATLGTSKFLRGDATWTQPDYSNLTGVPSSFSPSAHAATHLSAGSDPISLASATLAGLCPMVDNTTIQVVASKLTALAPAWTAITGKPSTFPPSAHASTHQAGGSDLIALDTLGAPTDITTLNSSTSAHGLLKKLNGSAASYMDGTGNWSAPPGGGITDAPSDGGLYARQNGAWVIAQTQKPFVTTSSALPTSGNHYGDMRITRDTGNGWVWTKGSPDAWVNSGQLIPVWF